MLFSIYSYFRFYTIKIICFLQTLELSVLSINLCILACMRLWLYLNEFHSHYFVYLKATCAVLDRIDEFRSTYRFCINILYNRIFA